MSVRRQAQVAPATRKAGREDLRQGRLFFLINLIILIGYLTWLTQSKLDFLGTDPYGLRQIFLIATIIIGHIIAGFIFAFFKRRQIKSGQIE